jgi:hypothetical protein
MKAFLRLSFWVPALEFAQCKGDGFIKDSFFEVVDIVNLFIVVIVLLVNPASGRGTII